MKNLFDIKGKKVLITGATGGLGGEFAQGLAEQGAIVVLNGRNKEKLEKAVKKLTDQEFKVYFCLFDVTNSNEIEKGISEIQKKIGSIDVLINNAGINLRTPLDEFSDEDWDTVINTNLTAAFKVSKAVVKGMIAQKSGKIINIGSMQSELGRPTIAPYAASKGGLKMLTKGMAVDWAKHNIQINGIGPGYFKTDMTKTLYKNKEFNAWLCSRTPSNRWGNTEELLGALLFLSSDASNYVNGHMLYVDGGLLASV